VNYFTGHGHDKIRAGCDWSRCGTCNENSIRELPGRLPASGSLVYTPFEVPIFAHLGLIVQSEESRSFCLNTSELETVNHIDSRSIVLMVEPEDLRRGHCVRNNIR
jgi:hypothetical protein